jgi:hypothetical protein
MCWHHYCYYFAAMKKTLIFFAALFIGLVSQTRADTFEFSYQGDSVTANLLLTTGLYDSGIGGYQITDISGDRNGVAITGLVNNPNFPSPNVVGNIIYDNLLTSPWGFNYYGLFYDVNGTDYNIYFTNGNYYELTQAQVLQGSLGSELRMVNIRHVPDSGASVALLGGALLGLAALRRKFVR